MNRAIVNVDQVYLGDEDNQYEGWEITVTYQVGQKKHTEYFHVYRLIEVEESGHEKDGSWCVEWDGAEGETCHEYVDSFGDAMMFILDPTPV